jgi:hypothetical protein
MTRYEKILHFLVTSIFTLILVTGDGFRVNVILLDISPLLIILQVPEVSFLAI